MSRVSTRLKLAAAVALGLAACNLSMAGKDRCGVSSDCLSGSSCHAGQCVVTSSCPIPCGGNCCDSSELCSANTCKPRCQRDCRGKQCGDDTCGGSCGECGNGLLCESGFCEVCSSRIYCQGRDCGPDNCGRFDGCGTCFAPYGCDLATARCVFVASDAGMATSDAGNIPGDAGFVAGDAASATPDSGICGGNAASTSDLDAAFVDLDTGA